MAKYRCPYCGGTLFHAVVVNPIDDVIVPVNVKAGRPYLDYRNIEFNGDLEIRCDICDDPVATTLDQFEEILKNNRKKATETP